MPQLFGSSSIKEALVWNELGRLNGEYGTRVTATTFARAFWLQSSSDSSRAAAPPHGHIWQELHPTSNVLFVLRHEFAHAALAADELQADIFAAEWTAMRSEPLVGVDFLAGSSGDLLHPPGPVRMAWISAAYWSVRMRGMGKFVYRGRRRH